MTTPADSLRSRIASRDAAIGVVGLGYVGLPLALAFAEKGFRVTGFDTDPAKPPRLARGESYLDHLPAARIKAAVAGGRFAATTDFTGLGAMDAVIICVPTPLTPQLEPDMSYIEATAAAVARTLRRGQLVVLESTTYPGTTDELMRARLEAGGLKAGEDFFLAFSPEREDPGNKDFGLSAIPKVVGGVDAVSGDLAEALYATVVAKVVRVSSARAAEATKLVENIFRAVNIALVNELKIVYDRMGIDIWEVLDAAASKPFGFMRFNPGPGWGGHCIPLDPFYLTWKAREYGVSPKFIELAGEVNRAMPGYVVDKLARALNAAGLPLKGSRILLLGMAYKKDVGDTRESPALEILELLEALGATVVYHDPHVPELPRTRHHAARAGMRSAALTAEAVAACAAVVVVTDHTEVDYALAAKHARILVDARGVYHRRFPSLRGRVIGA